MLATIEGARLVENSNLFCARRLSLILIDTVFETASLLFLENVARLKQAEIGKIIDERKRSSLFTKVQEELGKLKKSIPTGTWDKIYDYHQYRNPLAHNNANMDVPESHMRDLVKTTIDFVNVLFDTSIDESMLHAAALVSEQTQTFGIGTDVSEKLLKATQNYYSGRVNETVPILIDLLSAQEMPHIRYLLAKCYRKLGKKQHAANEIEIAAKDESLQRDSAFLLDQAQILGDANRPQDALESLNRSELLGVGGSELSRLYSLRGWNLRGLCRFSEALIWSQKALEVDGSNRRAWNTIPELFLTLRQTEDARSYIDSAIGRERNNSSYYILRGRAKSQSGDYEEALKDLEEAWNLSRQSGGQGNNEVFQTKVMVYLRHYQQSVRSGSPDCTLLDLAESGAREGIRLSKSGFRPRFRNLLVNIYWEKGNFEAAAKEAELSIKENKYNEKNFQFLAFAMLGVIRLKDAAQAAKEGEQLAGQVVMPLIWCKAAQLFVRVLENAADDVTVALEELSKLMCSAPEFDPGGFHCLPVIGVLRKEAQQRSQETCTAFDKVTSCLRLGI